jgi:hypothetical protein
MPIKKYTAEQIIGLLREAEILIADGDTIAKPVASWGSVRRATIAGARNTAA